MSRIKAKKTSMYDLTSKYAALPKKKSTAFGKTSSGSYILKWDGGVAYLAAVIGTPLLTIETWATNRRVYRLTIEDLAGRGMIETEKRRP